MAPQFAAPEGLLEAAVVHFDSPALLVHPEGLGVGAVVGVQQRRHQVHRMFAVVTNDQTKLARYRDAIITRSTISVCNQR